MTTDWDSRLLTFVAILPVTAHPSPVHLPHSLTFIFSLLASLFAGWGLPAAVNVDLVRTSSFLI
jgi:hypothetical protein